MWTEIVGNETEKAARSRLHDKIPDQSGDKPAERGAAFQLSASVTSVAWGIFSSVIGGSLLVQSHGQF